MDLLVALLLAGSFFLIVYFIRESNRARLAAMPAGCSAASTPHDGAALYGGLRRFIAGLTFIGVWMACAVKFGFFFGALLGWLPAAAVGYFAGLLWPVAATGLFAFLAVVVGLSHGS